MQQQAQPAEASYPIGRGYGHDYMRGGEVFGGYGYADRDDYARRRGEDSSAGEVPDSGARRRPATAHSIRIGPRRAAGARPAPPVRGGDVRLTRR